MSKYRIPSWWLMLLALFVLVNDRYDLNTLELAGAAALWGLLTGSLDVAAENLLSRRDVQPSAEDGGKQSKEKGSSA